MDDKNFTTFERQIEILDGRGLMFPDKDGALSSLKRFGYYNIINGYKDPYVEVIDGKEVYKSGVTFEQIFSLYCLDRELRNGVMAAMTEIEDTLRAAIAHTVSEAFTAEEALYLQKQNYHSGSKRSTGFQRDDILKKFNHIRNDDSQPIKHYRETYGNVPPWILLKKASFGNLINFVKLFKGPEKDRVISIFYDVPIQIVSANQDLKNLFMDTLFVCLEYRNTAAHGGRIYNHTSSSTFRYNSILHGGNNITPADYRKGIGKSGIPMLISATHLIDNAKPSITIKVARDFCMEEHCKLYPQDATYLAGFMGK